MPFAFSGGMNSVFVEEAAAMLGVSRRTIYTRIREGRLRTIRTGGSQRVLVASIEALRRERRARLDDDGSERQPQAHAAQA